MVTIGICDDEQKMRKALRPVLERKLQLLGLAYQIQEYASGEEMLAKLKPLKLDILFLDIEMKELSGMDTAKELRQKDEKTIIIFVTAYPDFVFQGYEVHAFHYILKPYQEHKIEEVFVQALDELEMKAEQFYTIEQKSGIVKLPLSKTVAFQSDKRKVIALLEEEDTEFYGRLNEIAEELPCYFVRIHNRYLVNLNHITSIDRDQCSCGSRVFPVSRTYRQQLEVSFARTLLR